MKTMFFKTSSIVINLLLLMVVLTTACQKEDVIPDEELVYVRIQNNSPTLLQDVFIVDNKYGNILPGHVSDYKGFKAGTLLNDPAADIAAKTPDENLSWVHATYTYETEWCNEDVCALAPGKYTYKVLIDESRCPNGCVAVDGKVHLYVEVIEHE